MIKGYRNPELSWEKQIIFDLENECQITIEHNPSYGEFVSRIDDKEGYWHCSNGVDHLPKRFSWALEWAKPYNSHWPETKWIVPIFDRCYGRCPW
jgi:hypothetical protein